METAAPEAPEDNPRRRHNRKATSVRCWLADGSVERYTFMTDISVGGARVRTAIPPALGKTISLAFRFTKESPEVSAQGKVVWRSEGKGGRSGVVGVAFSKLSAADVIAGFVGA